MAVPIFPGDWVGSIAPVVLRSEFFTLAVPSGLLNGGVVKLGVDLVGTLYVGVA